MVRPRLQPARGPEVRPRRVLLLVSFVYGLVFLARIGPGVVTPLLARRFGLTPLVLSAMTAAQYLAYMLLQPAVGSWALHRGAGRLLALGAVLDGVGTTLFGAADRFGLVVASRALVGGGDALVWISVVLVLAAHFPAGRYGRALGWAGMAGSVGALVATFPLAWWAGVAGWRVPFLVVGPLLVAAGILAARQLGRATVPAPAAPGPGLLVRVGRRLRRPGPLLAPMLTHFGFMGGFLGFISLLAVPYLEAAYRMPAPAAAVYPGLALLGSLAGGPLAGWAGDRWGRRRPYLAAGVLAVGAWGLLAADPAGLPPPLLAVVFLGLGLVNGATVLTFAVVRDVAGPRAGLEAGLANAAGFLAAVVVPVAMGAVLTAGAALPLTVREGRAFLAPLAAAGAGLAGAWAIREPARSRGR
ncbi:MFS transporter [Candidatus Hydrogenisulfobacillus filiaventi]|uniref:MFS transporter n=1 Tax=Candidatus Hydrogenisulfobacillus filiaventi TaxID=2707344 RepID=A0A6F8ZCX2_9FIRM|nr:MFS transporter [Bacillota bacterium]CAB1127595.1 MFS transporter [Candidatus Hydrogenisulfobacillus filiaventi]